MFNTNKDIEDITMERCSGEIYLKWLKGPVDLIRVQTT